MESQVEVDETFVGGKRKNMANSKKKEVTGRGEVGKTTIAGAKDRKTNKISAKMVKGTDKETLQGFVSERFPMMQTFTPMITNPTTNCTTSTR